MIPRNSIVEANQSGLIAEPLVDVTPVVREKQLKIKISHWFLSFADIMHTITYQVLNSVVRLRLRLRQSCCLVACTGEKGVVDKHFYKLWCA